MTRPIVFVQYIAAIAVAEAIRVYGEGYEDVPVKLKWPNDICKYSMRGLSVFTLVKVILTVSPRSCP
jgi:hypothetical protein